MQVTRQSLFDSAMLQIGLFEARGVSDRCGDVERQDRNALVLPLAGVFAKHDGPSRQSIGTPSHAVFVAADTPYRISYPGGIGDRALIMRFGDELAPELLDRRGAPALASNGLLPPPAMMLRNLLRTRLGRDDVDDFEIENIGLDLLRASFGAMRRETAGLRASALTRRTRALQRVKEAIAVAPSDKWNVARLAKLANLSPFHLCHVFRQMAGTSIYDYVLQERLAQALDAVLDGDDDLTTIALDAGFSSHSHFTARFRSFFGCTPAALRRSANGARIADLRKIVTAQPH
ncbi:MAG: AraC family transcriptional regulator [Xanthobacteraceae bacterium]